MKKRELKKHIEDGFSQLAPDIFEAVMETAEEQNLILSKTELDHSLLQKAEEKESLRSSEEDFERKLERSFSFGKIFNERVPRYVFSACAGLVIICLCIFGVLGTDSDGVYFVLDINPSIQVEVDQSCRVKRLKGLNQDGKDVIKELSWKKQEPVQELIDLLIQDVVEKSYLSEGGGILVTITAADQGIGDKLEHTLSDGISQKLTELEVFGVTTAFQRANDSSAREGRKLLEAELMEACGLSEQQVQDMTVLELIQCCQENTSMELDVSEVSKKGQGSQQTEEDKGISAPFSNPSADHIEKEKEEDEKDSERKGTNQKKQSEVKDTKKKNTSKKDTKEKDQNNKDTEEKDQNKPKKSSKKGEEPKGTSVDGNSSANGNSQYPQAGSQSQEPVNTDVPAQAPPAQPDMPVQPGQEENPAQVPTDSSNNDKEDGNHKDKDKENGNNKDKDKENGSNKDKDKENGNNKDEDEENGNNKDKDKENGNNKDKDKENGNNKDKDKENGSDKNKDKEGNNKDKDKENGSNKDKGQQGGNRKEEQQEAIKPGNEPGKNQVIKTRNKERWQQ